MFDALKLIVTTFKMRFLSLALLLVVALTVLMIPVADQNVRVNEERQLQMHLRDVVDERRVLIALNTTPFSLREHRQYRALFARRKMAG